MSDLKKKILTTNLGNPVYEDQASITAGESGPTLLQDTHLIEKLAHFDRERIPERVVHAKGTGAHGYFEVTHDVSRFTRAAFLSEIGKRTDLFVRFSTVGGEKGSADSARDPRGFAVKFYTEEGNFDMVGNNTPVFFIRDAIKFPDFIHTQKRHPARHTQNPDMMWDFLSLTPESIHQVTILFSDRGTPKSFRHMDGHSSHTYMWYNQAGEYYWIKWHFKADLGFQTLTREEATELAGKNPDSATKDLYDSIAQGDYPSWTVYVQIMPPEEAKNYKFDPFDITKVWYHADYPLIPVGKMVLNRNPENFFAEVEQAAFSPGNFVPGIAASPDRMLQGRLFSYPDTQRHRLGPNFHQIPINAPKAAKANSYQRDGFMAIDGNGGASPNYYPNSFGGPAPDPQFAPPPVDVAGMVSRHPYVLSDIDFVQAGELYRRVMSDQDRANLVSNICDSLGQAQQRIQLRQTALFYKADPDYGQKVAEGLGLDLAAVKDLAAMSQEERVKATQA
ncbi:catalase [Desulforamulus ruminis]|uniref:Catalase n=1 Tax=Desulforamulus ruminis (strain ATCC 23193 / DSM 2154 / NCIMB 8452 / DL) TaxID=696281 RepID=F6DQ92_DESRL|nr:catalase [Desulforamulus ruminis]AEG59670.1 Catalase [Desulforamulus ruminis DSM 2154]